jgi:hypothetical protein
MPPPLSPVAVAPVAVAPGVVAPGLVSPAVSHYYGKLPEPSHVLPVRQPNSSDNVGPTMLPW